MPALRDRRPEPVLHAVAARLRPHAGPLLVVASLVAAAAAAARLAHGTWRLVSPAEARGGIDLRYRWIEVQAWFAGRQVYGRLETPDYPPASYPMLWPFVGWTDELVARWVWAATTLLLLAVLMRLLWRESDGRTRVERAWVALLPAAGYAVHGTLVTGQVAVHVLTALVAGTLLLVRGRTLRDDVLGSALVVLALVKPTLAVPIVWVAFLVPGRWRPAVLIVSGYAALSLFAAAFQTGTIVSLARDWLGQSGRVNLGATYGNAQKLLGVTGLGELFLPVALLVTVAAGAWVYRHRGVDLWLLLGVTGLVARLLTYHRSFDDLLIVLPTVALFRIAVGAADPGRRAAAGLLTAALAAASMAPRLLLASQWTVLELLNAGLPVLWLAALGYLVSEAHAQRRAIVRAAVRPAPAVELAA